MSLIPISKLLATGIGYCLTNKDLMEAVDKNGFLSISTAFEIGKTAVQAIGPELMGGFNEEIDYQKFRKTLFEEHPDKINHDLSNLLKDATVRSVGFVKKLYLEKITQEQETTFWSKIKPNPFKEEETTLKNMQSDLKFWIQDEDIETLLLEKPEGCLNDITQYLFEVSGQEQNDEQWIALRAFFKEKLPFCFDLAFKEALKENQNGRIAFQIWIWQDIQKDVKTTKAITEAILKEVQSLKLALENKDSEPANSLQFKAQITHSFEELNRKFEVFCVEIIGKLDELLSVTKEIKRDTTEIKENVKVVRELLKTQQLLKPELKKGWSELKEVNLLEPQNSNYAIEFLNGKSPEWFIIKKHTFKRDVLKDIEACLSENNVILLTSAGGEGKTTLLHQIGIAYFDKKYRVVYDFNFNESLNLSSLHFDDRPTILLLDNANLRNDIYSLLEKRTLASSFGSKNIKIVIASRKNEWTYFLSTADEAKRINQGINREFSLGKLSEHEVSRLADLFTKSNIPIKYEKKDLEKIIKDRREDFLLSTMITITKGKPFEDTIQDIVENIDKMDVDSTALFSLSIIVTIELRAKRYAEIDCYCTKAFLRECLKENGTKNIDKTFSQIQSILTGEAFIQDNGMKITTRNPQISELYYKYIFQIEPPKRDELDILETILLSARKVGDKFGEYLLMNLPYNYIKDNLELSRLLFQISASFGFLSHNCIYWINLEIDRNNIGDYSTKYSALWICKESVQETNDAELYQLWANLEIEQNNIGNYEIENTARWICIEGIKNTKNIGLYRLWIKLEIEQNNVGDYETENTARWICREGIKNTKNIDLYLLWTKLEIEQNNIGDYETENTARWICKEGIKNTKNIDLYRLWTKLEIEQNNVGDYETENTARWICREGIKNTKNIYLYQLWAKLEIEQNNVGDYETENTARWICREGIKNTKNIDLYLLWTKLEIEQNNVGDYETENTARWICREGIKNSKNINLYRLWAKLEIEQNNVGDYETENTARWICREGIKHTKNADLYESWAKLEIEQNNIGDYEIENTARWICREGIKNLKNINLYRLWAKLEIEQNNVGDYETENTARWICKELFLAISHKIEMDLIIYIKWLCLEFINENIGSENETYSAKWLLNKIFQKKISLEEFSKRVNVSFNSVDDLEIFIANNAKKIISNEISIAKIDD
ncbi:hypothetical protein VB264_17345 [Arcicella aquatica]|uniref:Novel STAND NTPase 5 domain-containing protein n=1 Tax=Arcicella aquatica TaxID=217141 RepID=A0ABU5QR49_9BACT|nr:hypothetical protein [Arcicella aquatica]MEA5259567.1 hypothetical protein [Arcicella aquatica]